MYYTADDDITVFFGISNITHGELNEKVNTMNVNLGIEDMAFRVGEDDEIADILAYPG